MQICPLPFGLLLKWSDGTRLEEVLATKVARAAGFPVPIILTYGDHPDTPHAPVSIFMTRLPGQELGEVYETLSKEDQDAALLRDKALVCSVSGTNLRNVRFPGRPVAGPFDSEQAFNERLLNSISRLGLSEEEFEEKLTKAKSMQSLRHRTVFTHGDLKRDNILFYKGYISGFIDWECAGWYPEYWEFTTALKFCQKDNWWYRFVSRLGGEHYKEEVEGFAESYQACIRMVMGTIPT
ncbi:kinase-like protein [Mytilinidion resinicola]|uniref:Kinase-like protein n=1 Tax=Mytilinidion resinicola TaxID=574789 RepID=A0A6A6XZN7_9PEZI|nr:kinase-like protein [Mytilinidion resinicola]KAF2801870.1 kinase-like protein [Mytilinidion resinicola]